MKPYAIRSVACMMYLHKLKAVRVVVNNLYLYNLCYWSGASNVSLIKLKAIGTVASNVC